MARKLLVGLLLAGVLAYGAALLTLVLAQRRMMYFPTAARGSAAQLGAGAETLALRASDGETIVAWLRPPSRDDRPLFLYLHGNGGSLEDRVRLLQRLCDDGSGVLAIDYRGYGGSTGTPTEAGLIRDGEAAYTEARHRGYPAARIVVVGESLGSGVAVALAAKQPVRALVLDSPFSSAADVAAADYPIFPVRLLMKDTFDSATRIATIAAPKLVLYGDRDTVIPRASALKLYAAAPEPKALFEFPNLGHVVLLAPTVLPMVRDWLAALPR